jgi:5-methylthioribose kinase
MTPSDTERLAAFLVARGLARAGEPIRSTPLAGGISSDIWRVDLPGRTLCVKRALPKLKVAAHWEAPVSRNAYEWAWLCFAAEHEPAAVPRPLAHDPSAGLFAMTFLEPARHPVWKSRLMSGDADPAFAASVGTVLGRLHRASADRADLAQAFDTLVNFRALRLDPYLLATAERHPDIGCELRAIAHTTAETRRALVHGDVSPKNILVGPQGPVLLDAECAWYGDPAFDLAFCLNHLLLKALVQPRHVDALRRSFAALVETYFEHASFEPRASLEARTARLLPALALARVDGKSPVEYLIDRADAQAFVRQRARAHVARPAARLSEVADGWYGG